MNESAENLFDQITIVIVTFKSDKIIEKCISNLDEKFKKVIVENSNNTELTKYLKTKYKNLECINIGYDAGYGFALNRGIEVSRTRYVLCLNPDTFPEKNCIKLIYWTIKNYLDAAMVVPITIRKHSKEFDDYGYFDLKINEEEKDTNNVLRVDWVNGNIVLLDKNVTKDIGLYDENIFLQWEERDFQKRILNYKKKVFINFNAVSHHLEGQSHDPKFNYQMKCEVSWHHGWSKFYFYKKHYDFKNACLNCCKDIFVYSLKSLAWLLLFKWKKANIYRMFVLGFIFSLFNKKASYRAKID